MAEDLPNWNLNIIGCWWAYCSTRKQKYKEKDDVWPEHCSKISSQGFRKKRENLRIFHQRRWIYSLVNSLLLLEWRKENNMSRLLSEESCQVFTVILQGTNMGKGHSLILNLWDWETHWKQSKKNWRNKALNDTCEIFFQHSKRNFVYVICSIYMYLIPYGLYFWRF